LKKLYVDITELYAWKGKVTGIIRVMDELSRRFADEKKVAPTFVLWDERTATFLEVDFAELMLRRKHNQKSVQDLEAIDEILPIYRAGLRIPFSRTIRRIKDYPKNSRTHRKFRDKSTVNFKRNSLLFMPHGGVWGSKKYAAKVFEFQKDLNLNLVPILYDLCPVVSPQFCSKGVRVAFKKYMSKMLVKADLVLAISENTAQDARAWIKSETNGKAPAIQVFRLGDEIGGGKSVKPQNVKLPLYSLCRNRRSPQKPCRPILCLQTGEATRHRLAKRSHRWPERLANKGYLRSYYHRSRLKG
jgi:hypothetical protein